MAVEIDLCMYRRNLNLGSMRLYFGNALSSQWDGWDWVKANGMKVDPPWVFDDKGAEHGSFVSREQIIQWIENGYLSCSPRGDDMSADFIKECPKSTTFKLCFLDWS